MLDAFALGLLAQSSLLVAGLVACWIRIPVHVVGALAGFGAGALIAAVAFDLLPEAHALDNWQVALWMLIGVGIFLGGDYLVERRFGGGGDDAGGATGIVVGSVVEGVPESLIFGIQIATGSPVSLSFVGAVFVSNVPQSVAPSSALHAAGWSSRRIGMMWASVLLACGVAAALGYVLADATGAATGDRMAAIAAGGLLAMLTDSLIPFAYERGGSLAGVATVVGFCASILGT